MTCYLFTRQLSSFNPPVPPSMIGIIIGVCQIPTFHCFTTGFQNNISLTYFNTNKVLFPKVKSFHFSFSNSKTEKVHPLIKHLILAIIKPIQYETAFLSLSTINIFMQIFFVQPKDLHFYLYIYQTIITSS